MKKSQLALYFSAVAAGSALISSFVTYQIALKKIGDEFDQRLEKERLATADFLESEKARLRAARVRFGASEDAKPATPQDIVTNHVDRIDYTQYNRKTPDMVQPEGDLSEIPKDGVDDIVVIDTDEFMANESEYEQFELHWFGEGAVLDDLNEIVPDYIDMIGPETPPFGDRSGEEHVVYIRNNRRRQEYEVLMEQPSPEEALAADLNIPGEGSST